MATILEICNMVFLGLILLIPLTNPLTSVALFLSMSGDMSVEERHHQSKMASVYVFLILVLSFVGGEVVMSTFGISIPGLRIAGGLIVAYIGFRMLFPAPVVPQAENSAGGEERKVLKPTTRNIAFVPLAMPSTAGPGTIAMVISAASSWHQHGTPGPWVAYTAVILTSLILSFVLWISLRSSDVIMKTVGKPGIEAISRVMGFLLVCMGVQFMINGILEIIRTYQPMLPH